MGPSGPGPVSANLEPDSKAKPLKIYSGEEYDICTFKVILFSLCMSSGDQMNAHLDFDTESWARIWTNLSSVEKGSQLTCQEKNWFLFRCKEQKAGSNSGADQLSSEVFARL